MATEYRVLVDPLVQAMDRKWPEYKLLRDQGLKFKNDAYSNLKRGGAVPAKLIVDIVRAIVRVGGDPVRDASREAIIGFLSGRSSVDTTAISDDELLAVLSTATTSRTVSASARFDFLQRGFDGIVEFVKARFTRHVTKKVQRCADADVPTAIHWLFVAAGRYLAEEPALDTGEAVRRAESLMKIAEDEYAALALAWVRRFPWSVVFVRGPQQPDGVSIVLPLAAGTHESLLDGEMPTYACPLDRLASPTCDVVIEAVAERPLPHTSGPTPGTSGLYYAILAQVAALTRIHQFPPKAAIRLLSFAASPLTRRRLVAYGYKPTGRVMAATGVEFLARRLSQEDGDFLASAVIHMLSNTLEPEPPR